GTGSEAPDPLAGNTLCGLGTANCPFGSFAFRIATATGLMFDPSHATCAPPACVKYPSAGWPDESRCPAGQNCAPSVAADRSEVSSGRIGFCSPLSPFTSVVP